MAVNAVNVVDETDEDGNMNIALTDAYFIGKTIYPEQFSDIDINEREP